ncbi:MAG TPA: hypothetical protein VHO50_12085 [Bacteroidales bacterium]|nr:hypothetical protein [Bacteroidales bacterium]
MRYYFIIICINLVLIPINAQKITRVSNFREVVVIKGDTVIRTYILTEDAKKDPDLQRQYYWYSNGIINSNKGGYSGKLLHNGYEAFVNNNLIESGNFKKGVKTGKWLVWWESGSIRKISTYEDGVLNGKYTVLKENGDVELDGIYRKGKFHLSGKIRCNKGIR